MKEYINKIISIEKSLSIELGKFNLFALFEREDINDKWDILISMDIPLNKKNEVIERIHNEFLKELPNNFIINISRIVFLETINPIVQNLNNIANVEHGIIEIKDLIINNLKIKNALIISSQKIEKKRNFFK